MLAAGWGQPPNDLQADLSYASTCSAMTFGFPASDLVVDNSVNTISQLLCNLRV